MLPRLLGVVVRNPFASAGWLLFLAAAGRLLLAYGSRWEFGRYGMARSLTAPDGRHYADGSRIDPLTRALIAADREEEVLLAGLLVLATLLGVAFGLARSVRRGRRRAAARFRRDLAARFRDAAKRNPPARRSPSVPPAPPANRPDPSSWRKKP